MTSSAKVWFRRDYWWSGYVPCHWKGFAVLLGGLGLAGASIFAGLTLGQHSPLLYGMCFAFSGAVILSLVVVARRHGNR